MKIRKSRKTHAKIKENWKPNQENQERALWEVASAGVRLAAGCWEELGWRRDGGKSRKVRKAMKTYTKIKEN